jgi:hypothetical protein
VNRAVLARVRLYAALLGFVLTAFGIALDSRPVVWAAIAALAVALGIRLWLAKRPDDQAGAGD